MRDTQVFFDVLSFPTDLDPTTGSGIVIDGPNGEIRFYRNGVLFATANATNGFDVFAGGNPTGLYAQLNVLGGIPFLALGVNDVAAVAFSGLGASIDGVGGARRIITDLIANSYGTSDGSPVLRLFSGSQDGTNKSVILIDAADLQFTGSGVTPLPDVQNSIGRGLAFSSDISNPLIRTVNDAARAPGANTDFVFLSDINIGRVYEISLDTRATLVTAATSYFLELTQDGTQLANMGQIASSEIPGANAQRTFYSRHLFIATADVIDSVFRIRNSAASGGNVTMNGTATSPRSFYIKDIGGR